MTTRIQPKKRSVKVVPLNAEAGPSRSTSKKAKGVDAMDVIDEDGREADQASDGERAEMDSDEGEIEVSRCSPRWF